jgi:hypothetical protein
MTITEQKANQLYQHLEKMFDVFWYQHKADDKNYLASELQTVCRESAEKIKSLVKEYSLNAI